MKHRNKVYAIFFLIIIGFIILTTETFEERVFFSSNRGLSHAVWNKDMAAAKFYVTMGADLNSSDKLSFPLNILESSGVFIGIFDEHDLGYGSHNPLGDACDSGQPEMARYLIGAGADPGKLSNHTMVFSFIGMAGRNLVPNTDCMEILFKHGSVMSTRSDEVRSSAMAISSLHIDNYKRLEKYFAPFLTSSPNVVPELFLPMVVGKRNYELLVYLAEQGMDMRSVGEGNWSLLHVVAKGTTSPKGNPEKMEADITSFLLGQGVDINARDNQKKTPLHIASELGRMDYVRFLVESGADPAVRDNHEFTPVMGAAVHGKTEVAEYLLGRGAILSDKDRCVIAAAKLINEVMKR